MEHAGTRKHNPRLEAALQRKQNRRRKYESHIEPSQREHKYEHSDSASARLCAHTTHDPNQDVESKASVSVVASIATDTITDQGTTLPID